MQIIGYHIVGNVYKSTSDIIYSFYKTNKKFYTGNKKNQFTS